MKIALAALILGPVTLDVAHSQDVDADEREAVIATAAKLLEEHYVLPELAVEMRNALWDVLEDGAYEEITDGNELAGALQRDLLAVCADRHLSVRFYPEGIPPSVESEPSPEEIERGRAEARRRNFGFERVERLPGNVGLLDLRGFNRIDLAAETAAAAMNFLSGCDALIVDLRRNGGGDPATVAFLSTYLFGPEPVHLNSLYDRAKDSTHQWWTLPHVPGRRLGPDVPVWVLTSSRTFSAAEEFTYNLKCRERATIVGETSGGGAHPVRDMPLGERFGMRVPYARAINPITGDNWEGRGVEPHVKVSAERAQVRAHLLAIETLLEGAADPQHLQELQLVRAGLQSQ